MRWHSSKDIMANYRSKLTEIYFVGIMRYYVQRFGVGKKFVEITFLWSPELYLFDQKYCNNNIVKYYYNLKDLFSIWIYFNLHVIIPVMRSCIFSIITQTSASRDPSEIILMIKKHDYYYQCWKQLCCFIFCGYPDFFRILWWIEKKDKCLYCHIWWI